MDVVVGGQSESQGLPGHHGPGVASGDIDGAASATDAAITNLEELNNLKHIGNLWVDDTSATVLRGSGEFILNERYVSVVVVNAQTDTTFDSVIANHFVRIEDLGEI